MAATDNQKWDKIIRPRTRLLDIHPWELWRYRDLIGLFVWRDFVSVYKQTILGPLWYLIQPLLTSVVFTVLFGNMAHLTTDGIPPFLFYLSGIVVWKYFADCLNYTSNSLAGNAHLFGKVYFPRLTVPVSVVITNLIPFGIQFLLFLLCYLWYWLHGTPLIPQPILLLMPLLVLQMACLALGYGILVSSMTTRYRDLSHLVTFGVQLWMYATPVVYPASLLKDKWRFLLFLNPMAPLVEGFRYSFFGTGSVDLVNWLASLGSTALVLATGIILFNRVERTFMDTV